MLAQGPNVNTNVQSQYSIHIKEYFYVRYIIVQARRTLYINVRECMVHALTTNDCKEVEK